MRILKLNNQDLRFYPLVGPLLSRRQVVRELGFPLWDDDDKHWYIAMNGRKLLGLAALQNKKGRHVLCSAYVLPEHRRRGVYTELIRARIDDTSGPISVTATATSKCVLQRAGLKVKQRRGRYFHMGNGESYE